jgi:hypothetical protein
MQSVLILHPIISLSETNKMLFDLNEARDEITQQLDCSNTYLPGMLYNQKTILTLNEIRKCGKPDGAE